LQDLKCLIFTNFLFSKKAHNGLVILLRGDLFQSRATNANPSAEIAGYTTENT